MTTRLDGTVALVTGAFGGLGRDFAGMLGRSGAAVGLAGRRLDEGKAFADELAAEGIRAQAVFMDVEERATVEAAVAEIGASLGAIGVLVNNAGIATTKPFLEQTEDDWRRVVDVNLNGAWRVAQVVAIHMRDSNRGGSIINIASILGLRVAQQVAAYAASKAGLIQLTKAMALELARYGIRVNALAPGYIETPLNKDFFASDAGQTLIKRIPQRRLGQPQHLEGPLLLLASAASAFMTGSVIVVDGGHSINTL
ncbi:MAG: short chain dehydrogenase [Burkholderia sp.]|nr:short chain dehydrogenase [Burkholderia sp.]